MLRCGDAEGVGGEGGARVGGGRSRSGWPEAEVEGTAGEAAAVAAAEEVGRFWKYCSPGSSSSRPPHGYTCWESHRYGSPAPLSTRAQDVSDLLQLQLQGPVALGDDTRPGVQDHAQVRLG